METTEEHASRILKQKTKQRILRSNETPDDVRSRQVSDALNKASKTSAKADAFENSLKPNEDWNMKIDNDMLRHRKSRAIETAAQEKHRKDKDAEYQRKARLEE